MHGVLGVLSVLGTLLRYNVVNDGMIQKQIAVFKRERALRVDYVPS